MTRDWVWLFHSVVIKMLFPSFNKWPHEVKHIYVRYLHIQSTPVISRLRFRAKAQTLNLQDHGPTFRRLHLLNPNSMLSDNGCTYISRNYTSNKSQQAILYFNNYALKIVKLHVA